jgi:hypothetical protein
VLAAILMLGFYARVDALTAWEEQARAAFHQGLPLLTNFDGYFFLSLARDLLEGSYTAIDALRAAPMGAPRPEVAPLIAVVSAGVASLTGVPLDWVAAYLPAFAGPLAALPVYAIGRRSGGAVTGLCAALLTVLSVSYVWRSAFGFHDTDCLNVFFAMALAWWSLRAPTAPGSKLTAWLAVATLMYLVFLWWWTFAAPVVTALAGWSVLCALGARGWRRADLAATALLCAALLSVALAWRGSGLPLAILAQIEEMVSHVTKSAQGDFPNIAPSIGEQMPAGFWTLAEGTLGDPFLVAVATAGLAWLLIARWRTALVLLPTLSLGLLAVLFAQRFLIFAGPLLALGVGWLAGRAFAAVGRRPLPRAAVVLGVLAVAAPALARVLKSPVLPLASPEMVSGMRWLERDTPADAVVWAQWDYGYTLRYFARRAVVNDGSTHGGELTVYNDIPLAAASFREAANFMQFYARHGRPGMERVYRAAGGTGAGLALARRVFAAGPAAAPALIEQAGVTTPGDAEAAQAWLTFLFPDDAPSLYLLLDQRLLLTTRSWSWFGTWDPDARRGHAGWLRPFYGLNQEGPVIAGEALRVDLLAGTAAVDDAAPEPLSRIVLSSGRGLRQRAFHAQGPEFHWFSPQGFGVLQDPRLARSVFSRAFVLKAVAPEYFRPAQLWSGTFQIWEVRGDRARRPREHRPAS